MNQCETTTVYLKDILEVKFYAGAWKILTKSAHAIKSTFFLSTVQSDTNKKYKSNATHSYLDEIAAKVLGLALGRAESDSGGGGRPLGHLQLGQPIQGQPEQGHHVSKAMCTGTM